ncbi:MAG: hypothetical protein KC560_12230 [Myxococcales bacterium]|nr:hypothetical protein [Myxococcales bacterium]
MSIINGRASVLQIETANGSGVYVTVGGQRTTSLQVNNQPVDVSSKDTSAGFTAWDSASSLKDVQLSAEGITDDGSAGWIRLRDLAYSADPSARFRILEGSGGIFEGEFVIDNLAHEAPHQGTVTYSVALRNKGDVTYT